MANLVCRHGAKGYCDRCYKTKWQREWYKKNPDKRTAQRKRHYKKYRKEILAKNRSWREKNPEWVRRYKKKLHKDPRYKRAQKNRVLKLLYGISLEDFLLMRKKQKNSCASCKTRTRKLVVDHCHKTGKVRGLLCNRCNLCLGMVEDNVKIMKGVMKYLSKEIGWRI